MRANWQDPPFNKWGFQHVRELIPTQRIAADPSGVRPLVGHDRAAELEAIRVPRASGGYRTFGEVLVGIDTDAALIVHDNELVFEKYAGDMQPDTPHLLMSVSKSLVGCVAGVLAEQGILDIAQPAERYVPEIRDGGYGGAKVRDLLDMRTGVHFSEDYTDSCAEVRLMEGQVGWRPAAHGRAVGLYSYLASLVADGPHGGAFTYRSADTDMLGWVCERAAGTRMADLLSSCVWQPMGAEFDAEVTCDALGTAVHDGGVCARPRDLARFGLLLLEDGRRDERVVIPDSWFRDGLQPPEDGHARFLGTPHEALFPGGWYRSKFWFVPGPDQLTVQLCRGIYGQLIMVDRATRTVSVQLSSWSHAEDRTRLLDTLNAYSAVGRHLAGLAPARWF